MAGAEETCDRLDEYLEVMRASAQPSDDSRRWRKNGLMDCRGASKAQPVEMEISTGGKTQLTRRLVVLAVVSLVAAACSDRVPAAPAPLDTGAKPTGAIDLSSLEGRIVFSAGAPCEEDIYVINADGTGRFRVTRRPGSEFDPAWSPDGRHIVYRDSRRGINEDDEIFIVNTDGSAPRNLTKDPGNDWGPAWSPDGSRIAWNSDRLSTGELQGFVMHPDGSGIQLITDEIFFEYPAWSPDGERIAFMSQVSDEGFQYDIFVMNSDGTDIRRLTDFSGDDGWPTWSPDGTKILFTSIRDDCQYSDAPDCKTSGDIGEYHTLYVMNANGTDETRVSEAFGQIADWSPDGRFIVFEGGGSGLSVMRADGSGLTTIPISVPYPLFPDWIP